MTTGTTSIDLTPTGVGSDYDAKRLCAHWSKEVMSYTRSGDTLTMVRGQKDGCNDTYRQGDTVQLCKQFSGQTSQDIVYDLLVILPMLTLHLSINLIGTWNKSLIYHVFITR